MEYFIDVLNRVDVIQILSILSGIWLFYSRLDKKIEKLDKKFDQEFKQHKKDIEARFDKQDKSIEARFERQDSCSQHDLLR